MDIRKDYYSILGVPKIASREEIRAAYRKLMFQYHPDRNPGDTNAEERVKEINEANDVLSNDLARSSYDALRKEVERLAAAKTAAEEREHVSDKNKTTKTRTYTFKREHKVYLRGRLFIKYQAPQVPPLGSYSATHQTDYLIEPVDVWVEINASDIHKQPEDVPADYQRVYRESDLLRVAIPQPVRCIIYDESGDKSQYSLKLRDIRIVSPVITHAQKEENYSFGTLEADVYAHVVQEEELKEEVSETECFGETGRYDFKEENGKRFFRKEHYNRDCSTYWEPWKEVYSPPPPKPPRKVRTPVSGQLYDGCSTGCSSTILTLVSVLFLGGFILFMAPYLLYLLVGAAVLGGLLFGLSFLGRLFSNRGGRTVGSWLSWLILVGFLLNAFFGRRTLSPTPIPRPSYDSLSVAETPVETSPEDSSGVVGKDTLKSHFIRWRDYHDTAYEVRLSVRLSDIRNSLSEHNNMNRAVNSPSDISEVYSVLAAGDSGRLATVYAAFDSLRIRHRLNESRFAEAIVSCIQSVPYYLILDGQCDASEYPDDAFIATYLAACHAECCMGGVPYGVRSPVEMLSDLKGDCDTRALLLYAVLKHFGYDVALLTSSKYKHALIGVYYKESPQPVGTSILINRQPYFLWETTSKGFTIGDVPTEISDPTEWQVSLLSNSNIIL